jgi:hypothetical protein
MLSIEIKINNKILRQINIINVDLENEIYQYHNEIYQYYYNNHDYEIEKVTRGKIYHNRDDGALKLVKKVIDTIVEKES